MQTSPRRLIVGGFSIWSPDAYLEKEHASMNSSQVSITPYTLVHNEGTVFLFCPLTSKAIEWIDEHVKPDATWFGNALVVQRRSALGLAQGMKDAGLKLA
jgi:hypothetical protein